MGRGSSGPLIRYLRTMAVASGAEDLGDGELLARFVGHRDETAFAALVRRHGPLVLGICRRVLGHEQDAEDAFQATFLVLASQAASIRRHGSVASFLHGVAARIAHKARRTRTRRRDRAMPLPEIAAPESLSELFERDLRLILDEEIRRLPEPYRQAFILCYLEGQTNAEAARRLGCPKGTVLSRLARARDRLAHRLRRRDIALSATALTTLLSVESLRAAVPPKLIQSTIRLGALLATENVLPAGIASAHVLALTTEGVQSMLWMKMVAALAMVLTGAALTATVLAQRTPAPSAVSSEEVAKVAAPEKKPAPKPVKEEKKTETPLDAVLRKWAEADERVREMHFNFTKTVTDKAFEKKIVTKGHVSIKKPDFFRMDMRGKDGQMEMIWLREGKRFHEFRFEDKTETILHMPENWPDAPDAKPAAFDSFLGLSLTGLAKQARWAIFGPRARDFISGSDIRLVKDDQWYVYLDIKPRNREDKSWFSRGRVVLQQNSYRIRQFWLEWPNGDEVLVDYLDRQTNPKPAISRESLRKNLPKGWKRIDQSSEKGADQSPSRR